MKNSAETRHFRRHERPRGETETRDATRPASRHFGEGLWPRHAGGELAKACRFRMSGESGTVIRRHRIITDDRVYFLTLFCGPRETGPGRSPERRLGGPGTKHRMEARSSGGATCSRRECWRQGVCAGARCARLLLGHRRGLRTYAAVRMLIPQNSNVKNLMPEGMGLVGGASGGDELIGVESPEGPESR